MNTRNYRKLINYQFSNMSDMGKKGKELLKTLIKFMTTETSRRIGFIARAAIELCSTIMNVGYRLIPNKSINTRVKNSKGFSQGTPESGVPTIITINKQSKQHR